MRTVQSLKKQEARLRKQHTKYTSSGEWKAADTVRQRLIATLNQIKAGDRRRPGSPKAVAVPFYGA